MLLIQQNGERDGGNAATPGDMLSVLPAGYPQLHPNGAITSLKVIVSDWPTWNTC
nr:hypothetical protein [Photorhabdus asymbiotica]